MTNDEPGRSAVVEVLEEQGGSRRAPHSWSSRRADDSTCSPFGASGAPHHGAVESTPCNGKERPEVRGGRVPGSEPIDRDQGIDRRRDPALGLGAIPDELEGLEPRDLRQLEDPVVEQTPNLDVVAPGIALPPPVLEVEPVRDRATETSVE